MTYEEDLVSEARADFSIMDMPMQRDREAGWRMLQQAGPLAVVDGRYFVTTSAGVMTVLQDPQTYSSSVVYREVMASPVPMVPIEFDPPEVVRYRRILAPFFAPGAISRLNEQLREQVRSLLAPMVERGSGDIVPELAIPYPSQAFLTLMGLPIADRDRLIRWKDAIIGASDPTASGAPPELLVAELVEYLRDKIAARKGQTGDDLLTRVVNDSSADALDDDELLGMTYLLVNAGLDTVTSTIALSFERLAADQELRAELRADRKLIPKFIEEIIRLNPVACFTPRSTTKETVLEGHTLPAGTPVTLAFAVANRDPAVYEDATRLDLHRAGHHWGFGGGVHRCLGSHLARAELRVVLEEWFDAVPDFTFQADFEPVMPWPVGLLTMPSVRLVLSSP